MTPVRKKRVWTVSDVAEHMGISHGQAKRILKRIDAKHGGQLLIPSDGANREYFLYPARLSRLEPDLFLPMEDLEPRIEALEEQLAELRAAQKRIALQVGQNTRAIEAVKAQKKRAA